MMSSEETRILSDPEQVVEPGSSDLTDFRLSWIYKLREEQLDMELEKFRLDVSGTVEEKKKRLVRFIKDGCASPQPRHTAPAFVVPPPPPLVVPTTAGGPLVSNLSAPLSISTVCERVRKWNLHFNGRTDPVEFLEKLCEFQEHSDIPTSAVLPALYEIFQGNALAWYRNNRNLWNCWDDFIGDFKQFYLPANYESFLEEQIFQRRQKVGESGRDYLVSLQTLLRRHGGFSSDRALQRLYGNLLPEYRQYIRQSEIQSPRDLIRQVEEYEALQREIAANRPAKPTAPSPPNFVRNQAPVAVRPPVTPPPARTQTTPVVRSDPPRTTRPEQQPIETSPIRPQNRRDVRAPEEQPSTSTANMWTVWNHDKGLLMFPVGKLDRNRTVTRPVPFRPSLGSQTISAHHPDNRPHVPIRIQGKTFLALIDTGAARSYVGDRIRQLGLHYETATAPAVQLANGNLVTVTEVYQIQFRIRNKEFDERLWYLPNLSSDVVLGMDILRKHNFLINPSAATVSLDNTVISSTPSPDVDPLEVLSSTTSPTEEEKLESFLETDLPSFKDLHGTTGLIQHQIRLSQSEPIKQRYRPQNPRMQDIINKEVDEMLHNGIIEPSDSPWSSPVVIVRKKDGKPRFCIDFRKVNEVTEKDAYPLPYINAILDKLRKARYISSLDLKQGYWQIPLTAESKPITAFTVPGRGLFQFRVMPFGLHSAPATFQRLLDRIIGPEMEPYAFAYLDDIIVLGETFEEHLDNLREVFRRLRMANLQLNPDKCEFCRKSLKYLGHIVTAEGFRQILKRWTRSRSSPPLETSETSAAS
ncbi:uncharacterized protein LOC108916491 [Anoplophora glabripennis]|uniref:uncharacterized protein LOC108916491 n=1 Tax=Anoplophora glabripennis TaxID=217634 RepID=UPI00087573A0|nr:uncharacterized protein LOC108916491 [Anoplophora glabripennis]